MASVDGSDLENGCLGVLHGGSYFPGFYIIGTWRDLSSSGCLFFFFFFFLLKNNRSVSQSSKAIKITLFNRAEWTFPPEQDPNALESHFLPSKTSWSHLHMSWASRTILQSPKTCRYVFVLTHPFAPWSWEKHAFALLSPTTPTSSPSTHSSTWK